jgi:hypothetical protein
MQNNTSHCATIDFFFCTKFFLFAIMMQFTLVAGNLYRNDLMKDSTASKKRCGQHVCAKKTTTKREIVLEKSKTC